ncbi:MAG: extracellular solute-binding protein [Oscillospiraceae bacterium]|nr:extracellular solute-binding protein [Oscillospiraceae bacterium]
MKKLICAIILICGICAVFAACASDAANDGPQQQGQDDINIVPDNTAELEISGVSAVSAEDFEPELPEADFDGYEFRILNIDQESMWWAIVDFDAEEENGEAVNDAMYRRNRNMEEKYGFKINETLTNSGQVQNIIRLAAAAGSDDYDAAFPHISAFPALVANNALVDLNHMPNIDLNKPWWNPHMREYLSMENKLFTMTSDLVLTDNDNIVMLMYNTKLAHDLSLSGAPELYALVDEGKWTFDVFNRLAVAAAADLNGNGIADGDEDRFGVTLCGWFYQTMLVGFGETITAKDEFDLPVLAVGSERFIRAYETMVDFMFRRDVVAREFTDSSSNTEFVFIEDRALFCAQVLSCVRLYRDMLSDFAMIPLPKLDENQERYYTPVLGVTAAAVPMTNPELDRTGHILEALAAESRRLVRPAYFEVAIGLQYLRDEDSVRMLDLMLSTQTWDIAYNIYNWGSFAGAFDSHASRGDTNFASLIERHEDRILSAIEKTVESFRDTD